MKSILFVTPSAFPLGGVATWLDYLVDGLREHGWIVHVVLASGDHHDPDLYLRHHQFQDAHPVDAPTGTVEGRTRALADVIARFAPDIVASANIPDAYRAVHRLRHQGGASTRVVMTLHALQPDYFQDIATFGATIDSVVCTNRLTCKLAEQVGGMHPGRVFYAPYGAEEQHTSEMRLSSAEELKILYCGRFDQDQKRVLDLPRILSALDSEGARYSLTLAGGGPLEAELRAALAPWVGAGRVGFAGSLDSRALADEYHKADVLLITSSWETGPIVAWEAMAAGVPVVSSRFLGSGLEKALADRENCLLFPIGDARAAASSLALLRESPELRTKLIRNGRKLVLHRYSQSRSIARWAEVFENILARPPRRAADAVDTPPTKGRLDLLLGPGLAENLRHLLRQRYYHSDPGGEWPHSYGDRKTEEAFLALAKSLDLTQEGEPAGAAMVETN